jgi:predicted GNAT family N-acyltransferase
MALRELQDKHKVNKDESCAIDSNTTTQDFYIENGYVVFTESYHLKRGSCCKSGCRHCPYGFKKK